MTVIVLVVPIWESESSDKQNCSNLNKTADRIEHPDFVSHVAYPQVNCSDDRDQFNSVCTTHICLYQLVCGCSLHFVGNIALSFTQTLPAYFLRMDDIKRRQTHRTWSVPLLRIFSNGISLAMWSGNLCYSNQCWNWWSVRTAVHTCSTPKKIPCQIAWFL